MNLSFRWLFDAVADDYETCMLPVVEPLAANLVKWAASHAEEVALDVGTGTGIAARYLAPQVRMVYAVDIAHQMVREGRYFVQGVHFVQGDVHSLCLPTDGFDLIVSSFGLNATDPARSLTEIRRVLRPEGRLCLQEWGALHPLDALVADALEIYAVADEDAPVELVALRDFLEEERPWYRHLQDVDDYQTMLTEMGFIEVEAREHKPVALKLTVETFMNYRLSWTSRKWELDAMDDSARGDCIDRMRTHLYEKVDADGLLTYDPMLFRVRAYGST